MARAVRYHYPGCFYHVMLRGNRKQDIFYSDSDHRNMCFLLQEGVDRYGHRIHAFCFMKNHIHLLIQVSNTPLSKIMHNLASRYSQKINRKHDIMGHLFQGRYKAIVVQDGVYFTRLIRYIHRNPIRAGIVKHPEDYYWSSHNVYMDRHTISWISQDFGLSKFGRTRGEAIKQYSTYVSEIELEQDLKELRGDFKDGQVLGDDDFLGFIKNQNSISCNELVSIESIVKVVCKEFNIQRELLMSGDRSKKVTLARGLICKIGIEKGGVSMTELGEIFNRDRSTINGILGRFEKQYKAFSDECIDIETITNQVQKLTQQLNA